VYFEAKIPGDASAQADALLTVRQHIQTKLNQGETRDFRQSPSDQGVPAKQSEQAGNKDQERGR
jgi:cell filamentation protein